MAERSTARATGSVGDGAEGIAAQLERRRIAAAERWSLDDEVVLIGAGGRIRVPGRADLTYPFRAHSEYLYLTDRERPGGVLAFDAEEGWVDFVEAVTRDERLWEGAAAEAGVGVPVSELQSWLEQRKGRPIACLGAPVPDVAPADELAAGLRCALNDLRRTKDEIELERMRVAERATSAGFAAVAPLIEPGRTERELRIELEAAFFRNGGDVLAFDTIVAGGPNAAVLHSTPTSRPLAAGELVLIDAGAEYRGYASDITRTYPASGRFTAEQRSIYQIVRAACERATERCSAGTEWRDVNRSAALVITEGLVDLGLLRGTPESLVDRGAQSVFFPHGIGHMIGLGVRDAGEVLPGREPAEDEFPRLRVDLPLEIGHVVTVEPGIYFAPALIHDTELRERHRHAIDWEHAERMLDFGGIRIENNILITNDGPEMLTADVPMMT